MVTLLITVRVTVSRRLFQIEWLPRLGDDHVANAAECSLLVRYIGLTQATAFAKET